MSEYNELAEKIFEKAVKEQKEPDHQIVNGTKEAFNEVPVSDEVRDELIKIAKDGGSDLDSLKKSEIYTDKFESEYVFRIEDPIVHKYAIEALLSSLKKNRKYDLRYISFHRSSGKMEIVLTKR